MAIHLFRVKAIYYGCANDKFGGCGSVGNLMGVMEELGILLALWLSISILLRLLSSDWLLVDYFGPRCTSIS